MKIKRDLSIFFRFLFLDYYTAVEASFNSIKYMTKFSGRYLLTMVLLPSLVIFYSKNLAFESSFLPLHFLPCRTAEESEDRSITFEKRALFILGGKFNGICLKILGFVLGGILKLLGSLEEVANERD